VLSKYSLMNSATSATDPGRQTWTEAWFHRLRELNALRAN
jgi:hypothetical protein